MPAKIFHFFLVSILLVSVSFPVYANVLGDMQTFQPNTDGLDFISVHTSRPLTKGFFAVGGHFSYARNHLVVFKGFPNDLITQDRYSYRDQLVEFDTDIAYAIGENFSVFFATPTLLYQESEKGQAVDVEISRGVHTYRPGFKWTLGDSLWNLGVIASVDILNVTNSPYTGVTGNPIVNLEFAKTIALRSKVTYGFNLGYRWRNPSERPLDANMFPLDDQITFSLGRSAPLFSKRSRWVIEGIFSLPIDKDPYKKTKDAASADILLGFKHRILRNLNLDWGGTIEPGIDTQSPRYRVFAGLVYYFSPGWGSGDNTEAIPAPTVYDEAVSDYASTEEDIARENSEELEVTPERIEVYEGSLVRYRVLGGEPPYAWRIIKGLGRLNSKTLTYRAPLVPEEAKIEVRDRMGQIKIVYVSVKTPPKPSETIRIKNLNFIFDTDTLVGSSQVEIERIAKIFKTKNVSRIIVEGHTDSKGSNEYNLELSEKRAEAVKRAFIKLLGLKDEQITAIGFGEERPIATNATDKGRLANRRVDLKVYYR